MSDGIRFTLLDGMKLAGVDVDALWWRYLAVGGTGTPLLLAAALMGIAPCAQHEHDVIAQALNEIFMEQGLETFPVAYSRPKPRVPSPAPWTSLTVPASAGQARRDAAAARLRSAAAARRAAELHATAAQLMYSSGQQQFARQARARARVAQQRATAGTAA